MSANSDAILQNGGYDAAVARREDDLLSRWQFAKEIYGIATTGPKEWPVRIGIYGEWGTGKTSVLNMVASLAESHAHIIVRFNPWEFSNKRSLWHSFVQAVVQKLPAEAIEKRISWSQWFKQKALPVANWLSGHSGEVYAITDNKTVGGALLGLDLLKGFLFSKRTDLQKILKRLDGRRLIILIDDLDRTNGEIVPEMLFAIKELMNFGGIVFVCAFDPVIVGRILAEQHTGVDDGLKFLEKIIDYPRWLPTVSTADLRRMAETDVARYCSFMPQDALATVLKYLPPNARAVRQFVRLIALMRPQVERHRVDEIFWPVVLAANVIKIRFPQIASGLLGDKALWHQIGIRSTLPDEKDEIGDLIKAHVLKSSMVTDVALPEKDRDQIVDLLKLLAEQVNAWTGIGEDGLLYQMSIAESPAAVTIKEFDDFFSSLGEKADTSVFNDWIVKHASKIEQSSQEVFTSLFTRTVKAREASLDRAAGAVSEADMLHAITNAEGLHRVLEVLAFTLCKDQDLYDLSVADFKLIFDSFLNYTHFTNTQKYLELREMERVFLQRFLTGWTGTVIPLVDIIEPFSEYRHDMKGAEVKALYRLLSEQIIPCYAKELLARLEEPEFVSFVRHAPHGESFFFSEDSSLWSGSRSDVLNILRTSASNLNVHNNAYQIVHWFDYLLRKGPANGSEAQRVIKILNDEEMAHALWCAATAFPLNPRAIGSVMQFPETCKKLCGVELTLPDWWTRAIKCVDSIKMSEVPEVSKEAD